MEPRASISVDLLLRHSAGLRALARGLLRDEHAAEEVVQETLVAAVGTPRLDAGRVGGWLRRVARRKAQMRLRGDSRRRAREERASRAEALASTDEVVAQREVLRQVVDAVLGLAEPYQSVVLLRYFEGLPPREIARRRGAPVGTVNSQLQRALGQLRERLDAAAQGERGQWAFALAAVTGCARGGADAGEPSSALASLARRGVEVLAMHWKLSIGVGSALVVGLGYASRTAVEPAAGREVSARVVSSRQVEGSERARQETGGAETATDGSSRIALGSAAEERTAVAASAQAKRFELDVLVVDAQDVPLVGRPVFGAPLGHPRNLLGRTKWDGHLRIALEARAATLVLGLGAAPFGAPEPSLRRVELRAGEPAALRLAARRPAAHHAENGAPAPLEAKLDGQLAALGYVEEDEHPPEPVAEARPLGRGEGLSTMIWTVPVPAEDLARIDELVDETAGVNAASMPSQGTFLQAPGGFGSMGEDEAPSPERRVVVSGIVLDAAGEPARHASVVARSNSNLNSDRTDEQGAFSIQLEVQDSLELEAGGGDLGLASASLPLDAKLELQRLPWNPRLDRGLEVKGRLQLPEGASPDGWVVLFEAGPDRALWQDASLATSGRFAIPNLPERSGRVLVLERDGDAFARQVVDDVVPGGAELEIALDEHALASGGVALRVNDCGGEALASADVMLWQQSSGRGARLRFDGAAKTHRSGPVPPGRYRVVAGTNALGYRELADFEVLEGEEADLGVVALPAPGRLAVDEELSSALREGRIVLARPASGVESAIQEASYAGFPLALPAGDYVLHELRGGSIARSLALRIEPGETASVSIAEFADAR